MRAGISITMRAGALGENDVTIDVDGVEMSDLEQALTEAMQAGVAAVAEVYGGDVNGREPSCASREHRDTSRSAPGGGA